MTERVVNNITAAETIRNTKSLLITAHTNAAFVSPGWVNKTFTRMMETITEIQNPMTTLQKSPLAIAIPKTAWSIEVRHKDTQRSAPYGSSRRLAEAAPISSADC